MKKEEESKENDESEEINDLNHKKRTLRIGKGEHKRKFITANISLNDIIEPKNKKHKSNTNGLFMSKHQINNDDYLSNDNQGFGFCVYAVFCGYD